MTDGDASRVSMVRWIGLIAGPIAAVIAFALLPQQFVNESGTSVVFTSAGRATLAVMIWMAIWWLTEAIDISATALLPLVLFPLLGIADIKATAAPYASDIIFLFMGGFLLALSMQRWGLDQRIALITLRFVGTKPVNMIAGFMFATALLSAFVSNTATAAMMLPIAISVIDLVLKRKSDESIGQLTGPGRNFALCLMLGIAYAASIGGIATIIGTPPNVFLVGFVRDTYQHDISFAHWLMIGVPLVVIFLPIVWLLLTRVIYPVRLPRVEGGRALIGSKLRELGPTKPGEWVAFFVFICTAVLWIVRPLIVQIELPNGAKPWRGLSDAGIAMLAGMLLFVIPVRIRPPTFALNWDTAKRMPWGILILFGGGLTLADAVKAHGVAEFIGSMTTGLGGAPTWLIVLVVTALVIFLTELTSNTATTATLVPILAALAPSLNVHPYLLIVPAAIAASCAFMMPVATPPNAIVFGSGHVTIPQMCRAGVWLNLIGIVIITLLAMTIMMRVLANDIF